MNYEKDRKRLRELARQVKDIADKPIQHERRELWRSLNSLKMKRPMVNVNGFMWWQEVYPDAAALQCKHPAAREVERNMLQTLFHDWIGDDTVIEPWVVLNSVYGPPYHNRPEMGDMFRVDNAWGIEYCLSDKPHPDGSWAFEPAIIDLDDVKKMIKPHHIIDEEKTAENFKYVNDAIGDILPVITDRGPMIRTYGGSIIHDLIILRGYNQVLYDLYDNPEWLHELLDFMTTGVKDLHKECEAGGDLRLINTFNQSMTYCEELPDPSPSERSATRKELWHFYEGQEFTCVSPQMTDEFCIQYHKILAGEYGLIAYGCCEDLTNKISFLKTIPNLRCIAVTPWADMDKCAEQIGKDYVYSWRPNPAATLCRGFDASFLRNVLKDGLKRTRGCNVEINLKDVKTVKHDINAVKEWVDVAMDIVTNY